MLGNPKVLRPMVEKLKWKFSAIDGDPSLGEGLKCYATRFYNVKLALESVVFLVNDAARALNFGGAKVLRRKVEKVVYDDRSETVDCDGACPECHSA